MFKDFFLLTINYVISSSNDYEENSVYIYSPAYITPDQAGFSIGLIISDTYPCQESDKQKGIFLAPDDLETVGDLANYIIEVFKDENRICDLPVAFDEEAIIVTDKAHIF